MLVAFPKPASLRRELSGQRVTTPWWVLCTRRAASNKGSVAALAAETAQSASIVDHVCSPKLRIAGEPFPRVAASVEHVAFARLKLTLHCKPRRS